MPADAPAGMSPVSSEERASNDLGTAPGPRAGFWIRFGGAFVDGIILSVISIAVRVALKGGTGAGVSLLIEIAYFTGLIGSGAGQTVGMRAVGIRVISLQTGGSIGYGRAFIRWIASILSFVCVLLGYLWMLWDGEKQCWHDKLAGDVVVPASSHPRN